MRALIVEDDATIAQFVARGLREAGFAVDLAADGDSALAVCRNFETRRYEAYSLSVSCSQ